RQDVSGAARRRARGTVVWNRCAWALREVLQESWFPYPQFWKVLKILRLLQERARLARWSGGVPPPRERDALAPAGEDARGPWVFTAGPPSLGLRGTRGRRAGSPSRDRPSARRSIRSGL